MLAAARQLGRAVVGVDGGAITAQFRQALAVGAADFSTKTGTGRTKRGPVRGAQMCANQVQLAVCGWRRMHAGSGCVMLQHTVKYCVSALQPKPPTGGVVDGLPSMEDVPLDAMDAKEFQRRVEELASRSAQQPPSGAEDDTGLSALQEVRPDRLA
jgi:hypothetical protein